jgi:hypothetical protein
MLIFGVMVAGIDSEFLYGSFNYNFFVEYNITPPEGWILKYPTKS